MQIATDIYPPVPNTMFIFLFFKKKIDLKIEIINFIKVKGNFIKFSVKRGIGIISNLYFFFINKFTSSFV